MHHASTRSPPLVATPRDLRRLGLPAAAGAGTPSPTAAPSAPNRYSMNAAFMSLELHGSGSHAVGNGPAGAAGRAAAVTRAGRQRTGTSHHGQRPAPRRPM